MKSQFLSRKLLSVFVLVFMSLLLVACGGAQTETPVESTPTPVEETPAPVDPTPVDPTRIYFYNSDGWTNVSVYTFGPEFFGGWPGALATQDGNSDWYYIDVPQDPTVTPINIIFNNGGAGSQTGDIVISSLTFVYITVGNEVFESKAAAEDSVLKNIVSTAIAADDFNTLVAAVLAAELDGALSGEGKFTVFAPTDAAFATLLGELGLTAEQLLASPDLASILLFHVIEGEFLAADVIAAAPFYAKTLNGNYVYIEVVEGSVLVNGSTVILADVLASNGVIHVIDTVLFPVNNIVEVAVAADDFNTLVAAVLAAELDGALSGEGKFTVFAPTDAAFATLLGELGLTAEQLLASPDLASILLFHVIEGEFLAADVIAAAPFTVITLNGDSLQIEVVEGNVIINGVATVILADVLASNGVIHVIDTVLVPVD